ncbi:MAG TPA: hypothetical protein VN843_08340, partial [Anaerolineales bacterium]|nr:hypothetical protein [Anaerolineales bacterium]
HPKQALFAKRAKEPEKIYLHAEIDALIKARTKVYRLHVVRVRPDQSTGIAKPCEICRMAIEEYGVKVVTHT